MNSIIFNIMGVAAGLVIGMAVNYGILKLGWTIIPPPEGISMDDPESFARLADQLTFADFIFPLFAHALGTLVGAFIAVKIGVDHFLTLAMIVGIFFLCAGIVNSIMIKAPVAFNIIDFLISYIPMAWLGYWLTDKRD